MNIMYENSCEIMYKMISKRFTLKRLLLNKENSEIYKGEENLMSAIANNRRHPKKNRYLIPADTTNARESKNYVIEISKALEFDRPRDFLWGEREEIKAYAGYLFASLIKDAINDEKPDIINQIYDVLADYIPYAETKFYCDIVNEFGNKIAKKCNIKARDVNYYPAMLDKAIARLYTKVESKYIEYLTYFLYSKENTQKLNQAFARFVKKMLLPILQEATADSPIGHYAKAIITECHAIVGNAAIGVNITEHALYQIMTANAELLKALIDVQKHSEDAFTMDCINNEWLVSMVVKDD